MTNTSPRSSYDFNALGCKGKVAGWNSSNEREAKIFDRKVKIAEAKIPAVSKIQKTRPPYHFAHKIAAE